MASMVREAWTDERLDDLKGNIDAGFSEMRDELRAMRKEIRQDLTTWRAENREELKTWRTENREELQAWRAENREELKAERLETRKKFDRVHGDMREIRAELGSLNRTIHQFMFAIVGTIFLGFMGTISALITLT